MIAETDLIAQLRGVGLTHLGKIHTNLPVARLVEMALARGEGVLAINGALVAMTGKRIQVAPAIHVYRGARSTSRWMRNVLRGCACVWRRICKGATCLCWMPGAVPTPSSACRSAW